MEHGVKKSVVLHQVMDRYVRHTQALLLQAEPTVDATYSTALNFLLLGLINEALKQGGLSAEVRDILWGFARDNRTIERLHLDERLDGVRKGLGQLDQPRRTRK